MTKRTREGQQRFEMCGKRLSGSRRMLFVGTQELLSQYKSEPRAFGVRGELLRRMGSNMTITDVDDEVLKNSYLKMVTAGEPSHWVFSRYPLDWCLYTKPEIRQELVNRGHEDWIKAREVEVALEEPKRSAGVFSKDALVYVSYS